MSRSNNQKSDFFQSSGQNVGVSLFPAGLLMYDLPLSRRTASRTSNNVELIRRQSSSSASSQKQSSSPVPSSTSSASSIADDDLSIDDEPNKKNLTTTEDWWRQAIEPIPIKTISTSHSAFSMNDDDDMSNDTNHLFSLLPSLHSTQRIIVYNQPLMTSTQIYTDKAIDCVKQWYESHSVPSLNVLIKRGLLKIHKEKSIRMTISNKKEFLGQLDKNGHILSALDNRLFDSVEHFYQTYQPPRKRNEILAIIYQSVRWYDQSLHAVLLEYAETIVKIIGMKTRLIADNELLSNNPSIDILPKELLCQIDCWNEDRNEIDL